MTANEGRARLNLPRITDDASADALAMPLNTSTGAPSPLTLMQAAPDARQLTAPTSLDARLEALERVIDGEITEAA